MESKVPLEDPLTIQRRAQRRRMGVLEVDMEGGRGEDGVIVDGNMGEYDRWWSIPKIGFNGSSTTEAVMAAEGGESKEVKDGDDKETKETNKETTEQTTETKEGISGSSTTTTTTSRTGEFSDLGDPSERDESPGVVWTTFEARVAPGSNGFGREQSPLALVYVSLCVYGLWFIVVVVLREQSPPALLHAPVSRGVYGILSSVATRKRRILL